MSLAGERKPRVVAAAEKARRAQDAKQIIGEILDQQPRRIDRCVWCGGPAPNGDGVCPGHRDLGGIQ